MAVAAITLLLPFASAFTAVKYSAPVSAPRAAIARMFELPEEGSKTKEDVKITSITRSQDVGAGRTGSIVVTDGSGTFYGSRSMFNLLHDFGRYASITASSSSTAEAKKMLISRAGRYSGLLDVLSFHEGEVTESFSGADVWLAISPDEGMLSSQIEAAVSNGVSRIFLLLSEALVNTESLEAKLAAYPTVKFTVMRTGPLADGAKGGVGLKLAELDMPVCDEVPKEDVFRFVTEALSLEEAHGRTFSLCPSPATQSTLKEMRLCGYERREEVQFLLNGLIKEEAAVEEVSEEEKAEQQELVLRSEAEVQAERAEELSALLEKARQRGIETQKRMAYEEAEKAEKRKEMEKYYTAPSDDSEGGSEVKETAEEDKPEDKPAE